MKKIYLAESRLKALVLAQGMKLHFRKHQEFAIYHPSRERTLKALYYRVGDEFPVVENNMKMKDLEIRTEATLTQKQNEHMLMIREYVETHVKDVQKIHELEIALLRKDLEIEKLRHST